MKTYPFADQAQQHQLKLQPKLKQQLKKGLIQQCQQQKEKEQRKYKVYKEETDVALVVGQAGWWIPVLATKNNMRNLTFAEALRDFLQNVSFHCYGKLVETGRRYQERLFWLVFHIASLSTLIIFLLHNRTTEGKLLRTTLHDPLYPTLKIPFPEVSVCSINRISNVSATRYAKELNQKDPQHRGENFFYERIQMLQSNYYMLNNIHDYHKAIKFQRFLDLFDRDDNDLFYDTRQRMAMLTPNCTDILLECYLGDRKLNCAEEFVETFTSRGLCCTFKKTNNEYSQEQSFRKQFIGINVGLVLLLNAPKSDNFYKMLSLDGFIIGVYSSMIYPDQTSGGVEETFALTGTYTYLGITARVHQTVKEARFYSAKVRNCLFSDELPETYGSEYTFNNCITRCRTRSVSILCGCLPFHTSFKNKSTPTGTVICSLQHKECLMRYDFKWLNVITQRQYIHGLEREMEDALYCPECLPSCSDTRYKLHPLVLPLNEYNGKPFLNDQQNFSEMAAVRIYFGASHAAYYKRVLVTSWLEIFSNFGNICSIITGFSLIGVCEVLFFFVQQLVSAYKKELLWDRKQRPVEDQTLIILP